MKNFTYAAAFGGALLLAGCATSDAGYEVAASGAEVPPAALDAAPGWSPGAELPGAVIRAASLDGDVVNRVHFYPNGVLHIVPEEGGAALEGTWAVQGENLCMTWAPRGTECWPYSTAFRTGETVTLTSNMGQTAQVTLLSDTDVAALIPVEPEPAPAQTAPAPTYTAPAYTPPAETRRAGERG